MPHVPIEERLTCNDLTFEKILFTSEKFEDGILNYLCLASSFICSIYLLSQSVKASRAITQFCIILLLFVMLTIVICFIMCHGGVSFVWNHILGLIAISLFRGLPRRPIFAGFAVAAFCIGVDVYFFFDKDNISNLADIVCIITGMLSTVALEQYGWLIWTKGDLLRVSKLLSRDTSFAGSFATQER